MERSGPLTPSEAPTGASNDISARCEFWDLKVGGMRMNERQDLDRMSIEHPTRSRLPRSTLTAWHGAGSGAVVGAMVGVGVGVRTGSPVGMMIGGGIGACVGLIMGTAIGAGTYHSGGGR